MTRRQIGELHPSAGEKRIGPEEQRVEPLACQGGKGRIDLVGRARVQDPDLQSKRGAARSSALSVVSAAGPVGLMSTAMRAVAGMSSRRSSRRFATSSALKILMPVRLPPGRARLATRPSLTGSSVAMKTMGIEVVASLAASEAPATVAIAATGLRTEIGRQLRQPVKPIFSPAVVDRHVLPLDQA